MAMALVCDNCGKAIKDGEVRFNLNTVLTQKTDDPFADANRVKRQDLCSKACVMNCDKDFEGDIAPGVGLGLSLDQTTSGLGLNVKL